MEASIKEPNILQTYAELKTYFEKYACRIDDVLLYPVLNTKNERTRSVIPFLSLALTFAQFSINSRPYSTCSSSMSSWQQEAIMKSGLLPSLSLALTSAPF